MTRLFGVLGHPVSHSLSPAMHAAALRAMRLQAHYEPFDVPPRFLAPVLRALALAGVEGLNVTVPHKEAAARLMDRLDPTARAVGAVNTIVISNRRLIGYNTDGVGFRQALAELGVRRPPACAVILGAGGAARAVAWELARPGSCLTIANRHPARAQALARWLRRAKPRVWVGATSLKALALDGVELLVNATTVGLQPGDGLLVDSRQLRPGLRVYDLIYHRVTPLVAAARRRGCVAAGGLSMLLYQGAESLRLWLGRRPPVDVMRRALVRALESS